MRTRYLVCYDITQPRRWRKVYRYLGGQGIAVQYSVFVVFADWDKLIEMKKKLAEMINPQYDDLRIYPLPSALREIVLGNGDRLPGDVHVFCD